MVGFCDLVGTGIAKVSKKPAVKVKPKTLAEFSKPSDHIRTKKS